jgi:hypothetical protein
MLTWIVLKKIWICGQRITAFDDHAGIAAGRITVTSHKTVDKLQKTVDNFSKLWTNVQLIKTGSF